MKKVPVVEDDEATLLLVKTMLLINSFDVLTDNTGNDTPALVLLYCPDVILLGIKLPHKSGIEICRELKKTSSTPIVLFSTRTDEVEALRDSGADSYIQKPFDMKDFVSLITTHVSYKAEAIP